MNKREVRKAFHLNRALIIGILGLALLIGAMVYAWVTNRPTVQEGSKAITVQVVDNEGKTTDYTLKTDAGYLHEALDQIEGLTVEGEEGQYGMFVKSVNGLRADYVLDGAYWSLYLNGEYCNLGLDTQPVSDGDAYRIQYESAQ